MLTLQYPVAKSIIPRANCSRMSTPSPRKTRGGRRLSHDASASFETEEPGAEKIENKPEDEI